MRIVPGVLATLLLTASAVGARAETSLPDAVIAAGLKQDADCIKTVEEARADVDEQDLPGGLKIATVSCWSAAYNFGYLIYVFDPKAPAQARLLRFQHWDGKAFKPSINVPGAGYDATTRKLSSFNKGRGIGDCGSIGEWQWAGADFKMTGYWYKAKCDGKAFDSSSNRWRVFPPRR